MSAGPRVVVMAAGSARRFGESVVPKHLVDIGGEPLLGRIVRLWLQHFDDLAVIVPPDKIDEYRVSDDPRVSYVPRVDPPGPNALKYIEAMRAVPPGRDAVLVCGDVFFTASAVEEISRSLGNDDIRFHCRPGPSLVTGCLHGEIFAISVPRNRSLEFSDAVRAVSDAFQEGRIWRDAGWEIAKQLRGVPIDQMRGYPWLDLYHVIDDLTDDIDYRADYEQLRDLVPCDTDIVVERVSQLMSTVARFVARVGEIELTPEGESSFHHLIAQAENVLEEGSDGFDATPGDLHAQLLSAQRELDKLHSSTSWRVTAPMRWVSDKWFRIRRKGSD